MLMIREFATQAFYAHIYINGHTNQKSHGRLEERVIFGQNLNPTLNSMYVESVASKKIYPNKLDQKVFLTNGLWTLEDFKKKNHEITR